MNQRFFKYENKNGKKIRLKDLLMLFTIFTLCIITVIVTGSVANKNKKTSAVTDTLVGEETPVSINNGIANKTSSEIPENTTQLKDNYTDTKLPALEFTKPVDGAIIKPYSPNELVYSETMDDWRMHMGIDVACPIGSDITSCERGIVKSIEYDINYGNTVIVESDEYTLKYSSLSSDVAVTEGQSLSKGDIIGKSSDTCMSEICDEPHIHFEMTKNGEQIDPLDYIHFN